MYHPDYLSGARRLCDQYQIHLIADEIAVGFGRTGTFLACEQAGIRPDILCLSKGITGGSLPLACVLSTDAIYAAFYAEDVQRGFLHSHSYTGNALACRAALAVLDLFDQHEVLAQNQRKAQQFNALLAPVAQHPAAQRFRHIGMIWAFEDACQRPSRWWQQQALARGLLLRPIGHTVYLMPPYCITTDEMGWISRVLQELLDQPAQAEHDPPVA
jgi:adenosylmethionine---8-amino-7-oxononanoate aminotransferase